MTVRELMRELLDYPMDHTVQMLYVGRYAFAPETVRAVGGHANLKTVWIAVDQDDIAEAHKELQK